MKMPQRVLGLVTDAFGGRGGIAAVTRDFAKALAIDNEIAEVVLLPRNAPQPVCELPKKVQQRLARARRIDFAVDTFVAAWQIRPTIIYCNHLYMASLAAIASKLFGAKLVIHLHGIEIWSAPGQGVRRALESADLILCVSRHTRAMALNYCDLAPERVLVLNNTFDERFTPGSQDAARRKIGIGEAKVLLTVGRLSSRERYKGHDKVIGALPSLLTENPNLMYLIAGEGDDRLRLEWLANEIGVAAHIRFLGHVADKDLPDLYRASDLFVMPSRGEGFGIAFLEAMACGVPALGVAVGGAPDALSEGWALNSIEHGEMSSRIAAILAGARPSPTELSQAVRRRFGSEAYAARVASSIGLLSVSG